MESDQDYLNHVGTVYLIHFKEYFHHARHYIGFCYQDPVKRLVIHRRGKGAKLLLAVNEAGIDYWIVRTWPGVTRHFERKLKKRKKARCLCPICRQEQKAKRLRG